MKLNGLLLRIKNMTSLVFAMVMINHYSAQAQQEVQYSQYMFNMLAVNPAYAGSRDIEYYVRLYEENKERPKPLFEGTN